LPKTNKSCNTCFEIILLLIFLGGEIGLLVALIVMYANTIEALKSLNIDMFKFAVENQCSDGPLQRVMKFIVEDFEYEQNLAKAGLALTAISLFFLVVLIIYSGPIRAFIAEKCGIKSW